MSAESKPHNQPGQESSVRETPQQFDAIRSGAPAPEPHSRQELCDRVRRGLIEMTDMPDAFDAFLKIEGLLEQLEASQRNERHLTNLLDWRQRDLEDTQEQRDKWRDAANEALEKMRALSNPARVPDGGSAARQEPSAPGDASGGTRVSDSPGVGSPASTPKEDA